MNLSDRFKAALRAFIEHIVAKYDYFALYACTVVSQNGDGSLELKPDSTLIAELSLVPIKYGIPGVSAKVKAGGRALLGWDGGDPTKPYAIVTDGGSLDTITITAQTQINAVAPTIKMNNGAQPVARQGDAVSVVLPFTPVVASPTPLPLAGTILMGNPSIQG